MLKTRCINTTRYTYMHTKCMCLKKYVPSHEVVEKQQQFLMLLHLLPHYCSYGCKFYACQPANQPATSCKLLFVNHIPALEDITGSFQAVSMFVGFNFFLIGTNYAVRLSVCSNTCKDTKAFVYITTSMLF